MTIKDQFKKGLQWGACAWLVWIAWSTALVVWRYPDALIHPSGIVAPVWAAALALTWTRWSRLGVGVALVVQAVAGTVHAALYGGEMHFSWVLTFWLPMSLPLVPLVLMEPEQPRRTMALLLLWRPREALLELRGWRWVFVAGGAVLLNRVGWIVLTDRYYPYLWAILPALLFVIAAIPALGQERRASVEG